MKQLAAKFWSPRDLTEAQAKALFALLQAKAWDTRASTGKRTQYEGPWFITVHPIAARRLVRIGWARELAALIDGREVMGADLVHYLSHWTTKFEITRTGAQAWRRFTVRQRYGLPERAALKEDK